MFFQVFLGFLMFFDVFRCFLCFLSFFFLVFWGFLRFLESQRAHLTHDYHTPPFFISTDATAYRSCQKCVTLLSPNSPHSHDSARICTPLNHLNLTLFDVFRRLHYFPSSAKENSRLHNFPASATESSRLHNFPASATESSRVHQWNVPFSTMITHWLQNSNALYTWQPPPRDYAAAGRRLVN